MELCCRIVLLSWSCVVVVEMCCRRLMLSCSCVVCTDTDDPTLLHCNSNYRRLGRESLSCLKRLRVSSLLLLVCSNGVRMTWAFSIDNIGD